MSNLGEIGPAVGEHPEDLIPVVLAALDRVAKMQEPETFGVYCTTGSWWLINRLRGLRLQDLLAGMDHVVGPATGPRPLPGDPPRKIAVSPA